MHGTGTSTRHEVKGWRKEPVLEQISQHANVVTYVNNKMLAETEEDGMSELLVDEDEDDVNDIVENQDPVHTAVEAIVLGDELKQQYMTAYCKDLWFSSIYEAGQKAENILTLQERSLLKNYAVIEDMLYFTPKESPEVRRLCIPSSGQQSLRKMAMFFI